MWQPCAMQGTVQVPFPELDRHAVGKFLQPSSSPDCNIEYSLT